MLYIAVIVLGIAAGIAAKGKISALVNIRFEKKWLILSAFIVQAASRTMGMNGFVFAVKYCFVINLVTYCLLLAGFWYNRSYAGILMVGAGSLLNALAILFNGGRMPVSEAALRLAVTDSRLLMQLLGDGKHMLVSGSTKLYFLTDIIHLPGFLGYWTGVVSTGDLIVLAGVFLFMFELVRGKKLGLKAGKWKCTS